MRHTYLPLLLAVTIAAAAGAATVVMSVNGIPVSDYSLRVAKRATAAAMQGQAQSEEVVLKAAVEQVIGHVLLVQAAREAGFTVDAEGARKRVAALKARYQDPAEFARRLEESGTDEAELVRFEEENQLLARLSQSVAEKEVSVSREDAQRYYKANPSEFNHPDQVKVRMILTEVPEGATKAQEAAARIRIEEATSRLAKGEEFAKVAGEISDDASKARGGEVGWVRKGQLLPELDEAVADLRVGGVTKPIKTKFGFHIMGVMDRRSAGMSSFDEVEPTLINMLRANAARDAMERIVLQRRATAKIETLDPSIKAVVAGSRE